MKKFRTKIARTLIFAVIAAVFIPSMVFAQDQAVVNAVLFFSPSCGHCHKVITEDLPPLIDQYGEQLMILGIDVSIPEGQALYQAVVDKYQIPDERLGVPTLVVNDIVMVGSIEIPQLFPQIIEEGLASGGYDWPAIPGIEEILVKANTAASENSTNDAEQPVDGSNAPDEEAIAIEPSLTAADLTLAERFQRDLTGNIIAVIVLVFMVGIVGTTTYNVFTAKGSNPLSGLSIWVLILSIIGLAVAVYMSYVEITNTEAVCGPVGDCNTVQQSEYAKLFGMLPIGVLGIIGYLLILGAYFVQRYFSGSLKENAIFLVWGFSLFGTLFSMYLTFLEPFVIGATCAWCITSALVMTGLLITTTPQAKTIFSKP